MAWMEPGDQQSLTWWLWWEQQIGFAIADQKEGDFELRVQWIKAIAHIEGGSPSEEDEEDEDDDDYDR